MVGHKDKKEGGHDKSGILIFRNISHIQKMCQRNVINILLNIIKRKKITRNATGKTFRYCGLNFSFIHLTLYDLYKNIVVCSLYFLKGIIIKNLSRRQLLQLSHFI